MRSLKKTAMNNHGQMAIFIALLFQILFVFFAMIINIGLLIHDKINLQNSVDLAAIYGAQKQAEILNTIAHINYQIRQDYKLLTFRTRVLGEMGRTNHPYPSATGTMDQPFHPMTDGTAVCISHNGWIAGLSTQNQNLCQQTHYTIPGLPQINFNPAAFDPFQVILQNQIASLSQNFFDQCKKWTPLNWTLPAEWLYDYRLSVYHRKKAIEALAENLSSADPLDLEGDSIWLGAEKTLRNNLTRANNRGSDATFFNSLKGVSQSDWLPEVPLNTRLLYVSMAGSDVHNCSGSVQDLGNQAAQPNVTAEIPGLIPQSVFQMLKFTSRYDSQLTTAQYKPFMSTFGYEKNPWYMLYYGVTAKSKVRKPFMVGKEIELTARSFAQPFGGRVGPWYGDKWAVSAPNSSGNLTDPMLPPKCDLSNNCSWGSAAGDDKFSPNYSRFPGDQLGMRSHLALGILGKAPGKPNATDTIKFDDYRGFTFLSTQKYGDPLAWNIDNPNALPVIRHYEMASVAPDIFDITYYSIDPKFQQSYRSRANSRWKITPDIGWSEKILGRENVTVKDQILAKDQRVVDLNRAYYLVKNWTHLLTGWVSASLMDYTSAPTERFGKCSEGADMQNDFNPGNCVVGGRTGYSVKVVGKDFLEKKELELGGVGIKGPLKNPPKPGFGD